MTADFEALTIPGLHRAAFLHDGPDLTVELWLREGDELQKLSIPWLKTTDLRAIKTFLERIGVPTEIIDNS
jgi:hypothetical protein